MGRIFLIMMSGFDGGGRVVGSVWGFGEVAAGGMLDSWRQLVRFLIVRFLSSRLAYG